MNWKLVFLAVVGISIFVWLVHGWYTAVDSSVDDVVVPVNNLPASSTPPTVYVSTSTAQEVVLERQSDRSVVTLRGLGYASLPLRAVATTTDGEVYTNSRELLRAVVTDGQLQVFVADTSLFWGVATTTAIVE